MESRWCFAEIAHARAIGRPVLPVMAEACELPAPLQGLQAVAWREGDEDATRQVLRGLSAAGVRGGRRRRTLRRRLAWASAGAVVLALVLAATQRTETAYVTVTSLPAAMLSLDDVEVGSTPLARHPVAPGEHRLRLVRERFAPFLRMFHVDAGSTYELERGLQATDPADPEALRLLAVSMGMSLPDVPLTRGTGDGPDLEVLFPRGRRTTAPERVRLSARRPVEGAVVVLQIAPQGGPALVGPSQVLCSLWKVDDQATRALMTRFYALWNPSAPRVGISATQALKAAQDFVRTFEREEADPAAPPQAPRMRRVRPWSHPTYWAAWVVWGAPD